MNIQQSIKFFSAAALMSLTLGCSSSKQVAKSSNNSEVYDDMYASANETRPVSLTSRERYQQNQEEEYVNQNPEYRGQAKNQTQGTDEYYSQNWINSRQYYQNQTTPYGNNNYNNYNNGGYGNYNNGFNSPFNSYGSGFNSWYGNPGISFGLGFGSGFGNSWNRWGGGYDSFGYSPYGFGGGYSPFGFGGGYSPFGFGGYSPFNSYGYGYGAFSPYGYGNSFYDPYNSFYGRGYGNTYVYNYGNNVTGANGNYSNPVTPRTPRARDTYSSSAYNGDYNRGGNTVIRGNRTDNTNTTGNSDYYSRPRRDNGYSGSNSGSRTSTYSSGNSNSSSQQTTSWGNNRNSSSSSTFTPSNSSSTPSYGGSSSGGSSSGGSSSGGGGSRGPR
jgi:hypothetical protein